MAAFSGRAFSRLRPRRSVLNHLGARCQAIGFRRWQCVKVPFSGTLLGSVGILHRVPLCGRRFVHRCELRSMRCINPSVCVSFLLSPRHAHKQDSKKPGRQSILGFSGVSGIGNAEMTANSAQVSLVVIGFPDWLAKEFARIFRHYFHKRPRAALDVFRPFGGPGQFVCASASFGSAVARVGLGLSGIRSRSSWYPAAKNAERIV